MKINTEWKDYEIIATGGGEKLERWKDVYLLRPDPQAIWKPSFDLSKFDKLHARYIRSETGGGHWEYLRPMPESWVVGWRGLKFRVKPMGFKHTGLFPEQAANWAAMTDIIRQAGRPVNVLNLFAYTGGATVACLAAGASVCHVDAAKNMVERAKENVALSGLGYEKSRFIVELPPKGKGKKSEKARLFFCGGEVIAVSENLIDVFSDCLICERWTGAGKWNTPLVQKTDDFMLVMFPIRVDKAEFRVWKDVEV